VDRQASDRGLAEKYRKSVAQVSLRYLLVKDVLPLPKSVTPERIAANAQLDFDLEADDVAACTDFLIQSTDQCRSTGKAFACRLGRPPIG